MELETFGLGGADGDGVIKDPARTTVPDISDNTQRAKNERSSSYKTKSKSRLLGRYQSVGQIPRCPRNCSRSYSTRFRCLLDFVKKNDYILENCYDEKFDRHAQCMLLECIHKMPEDDQCDLVTLCREYFNAFRTRRKDLVAALERFCTRHPEVITRTYSQLDCPAWSRNIEEKFHALMYLISASFDEDQLLEMELYTKANRCYKSLSISKEEVRSNFGWYAFTENWPYSEEESDGDDDWPY